MTARDKRQKTKMFDYRGLAHFGKPASEISDRDSKCWQSQRAIENVDAHCFDACRQSFDAGLNWDSVRRLIDNGVNLSRAKELVRDLGL